LTAQWNRRWRKKIRKNICMYLHKNSRQLRADKHFSLICEWFEFFSILQLQNVIRNVCFSLSVLVCSRTRLNPLLEAKESVCRRPKFHMEENVGKTVGDTFGMKKKFLIFI
jgi:hypothetical protein